MLKDNDRYMENFYKAVLKLKNEDECRMFFEDVCTIKELRDLTLRLEVARLLSEGKVFNEISQETGSSSATISRVNKCLMYGSGGYSLVIDDLKNDDEYEKDKERQYIK